MKQVVQPVGGGAVRVVDVPRPVIGPTEVLVRTLASVVSPGTERAVTRLAQSNLLTKARARPDLVRQVVRKMGRDGVGATARSVRARLDEDMPLGYSAAGIVLEVGEAVSRVAPGQLVATGGAGKANHAEYQAVPGLLCCPVPDGVAPADAAFATVASIPLHGLRLAEVGPGARVVVIGLGLVGQLAVRLARASGCEVAAIDVAEAPVNWARASGALGLVEVGADTTKAVDAWSRGRGADAVLVTAATESSAVMARTPELCRDGAKVVVVGDVGLELDRRPFYERELTVCFARSYGPGRYERSYEEWAVDYPAGLVRWSEGRNLEAVLDLLASGGLKVADLVTHRAPIEGAASVYDILEAGVEPVLGVLFSYPATPKLEAPITLRTTRSASGSPGIGLIGAGAFAATVLLPAIKAAGFSRLVAVASASGLSARQLGERYGFESAVSGSDAIIDDPAIEVVVIATPHDTHAALAIRALQAGKHVFCEKPLALTRNELDSVRAAWRESGRVLFVDFNRRWSPAVAAVRQHFAGHQGPLAITYRVSAGTLPPSHWYNDRRHGGRLLGEVCHFVDTCAALTGEDAVDSCAVGSHDGVLLGQDFGIVLRYPSGSFAAITYASGGHPSTEKERCEILGGGRSAVIHDYRRLSLDGRVMASRLSGKGHTEALAGFHDAIATDDHSVAVSSFAVTDAMIAAVASLASVPANGIQFPQGTNQ